MSSNLHRLPIVTPSDRPSAPGAAPPPSRPGAEPPRRELLRVGDLARACGKTVRAIHHYEELGLLQPTRRSSGGYRLYAHDAVARVNWIGKLSDLGMTLSQIKEILKLWEEAPSAPQAMGKIRAVYLEKLREVQEQVARLTALERELGASLAYLNTCETCDPHELIAACSSCTVHAPEEDEPELVSGLYCV